MTATDTAIPGVRDVLYESDQDLYVYAPPDEAHFIGEVIVIGAAGVLLGAFFRGVRAAAEERMEEWGENLGEWLFDGIQSLFHRERPEEEVPDASAMAADARRAIQETSRT